MIASTLPAVPVNWRCVTLIGVAPIISTPLLVSYVFAPDSVRSMVLVNAQVSSCDENRQVDASIAGIDASTDCPGVNEQPAINTSHGTARIAHSISRNENDLTFNLSALESTERFRRFTKRKRRIDRGAQF